MAQKSKSLAKRILNIVLSCFLGIAVLCVALVLYSRITGKSLLPYSALWVLTDSMEDTIPAESYILVRTVDPEDIREEDIITFQSRSSALNGELNTHRVVGIDENGYFITQGDNRLRCPIPDPEHVHPEDVRSRYVCNLSVLTVLGRVYNTNAGFLLSSGMIILCMGMWFYRAFLEKKNKKEDAEEASNKEEEIQRRIAEEVAKLEAADMLKDISAAVNNAAKATETKQEQAPPDTRNDASEHQDEQHPDA